MGLGPKAVTTGGGAAKGFAPDFINWLENQYDSGGGLNTAISRMLSGQGLNANVEQQYNNAWDRAFGAASNVGLDPNSAFAQGVSQQLTNQRNQDVANLRARFGQGGGMSMGTPGAVGEARYLAESAPNIAATLGQYDLQKRGIDLQTLLGLVGQSTQKQMGGQQLVGQMLGAGVDVTRMGTPQAQTTIKPGFFQNLGGIVSGIGAIAAPFTGGLSGLIGGGVGSMMNIAQPNLMMPSIQGQGGVGGWQPNYGAGAAPIQPYGPVRLPAGY